MTVLVKHDSGCPQKGMGHSDAAKRIYDTYHLHRTADPFGARGKWFAAALNDGTTDGQLYDSKSDAIAHQHHDENYYTYIQITPANITVCSAEVMLTLARKLYDKGLRMTEPAVARREPIKRVSTEDQLALVLRGIPTGLDWSPTQN
jgi:hypothetical protein